MVKKTSNTYLLICHIHMFVPCLCCAEYICMVHVVGRVVKGGFAGFQVLTPANLQLLKRLQLYGRSETSIQSCVVWRICEQIYSKESLLPIEKFTKRLDYFRTSTNKIAKPLYLMLYKIVSTHSLSIQAIKLLQTHAI